MNKQEFEDLIGRTVSEEDYRKIECVYTFYPNISKVNGKAQIAYLYITFGMEIIEDMLFRAQLAMVSESGKATIPYKYTFKRLDLLRDEITLRQCAVEDEYYALNESDKEYEYSVYLKYEQTSRTLKRIYNNLSQSLDMLGRLVYEEND